MRPSDITDGIIRSRRRRSDRVPRFNEAVGYYRRNHGRLRPLDGAAEVLGFNEAVGYYRRNHAPVLTGDLRDSIEASMRPSDITDGIAGASVPAPAPGRPQPGFNEAVGYYRRNPSRSPE